MGDITNSAVWLASDQSECVVGRSIFVDGGMTLIQDLRPMDNKYDFVIIGSGAGGGTLAHLLAMNSEKRLLLLERGDYVTRERENWDSKEVFVNWRYDAPDTWVDKEGNEFRPGIHYFVGGNTKVYGAALMRL